MDIPLERDRTTWHSVLATFLWLLVALGGLSLLMALEPILLALGTLTLSRDVTGMVMDKYRLVSVRNFGLMTYGVIWLGGSIFLHSFYLKARTTRHLLTRFALVAFLEAGIWGLSYLAQWITVG